MIRHLLNFSPFFMGLFAMAAGLSGSLASPLATSSNAGQNDVPLPFSLGYVFTVNQAVNVTALGQFDILGNGFDGAAKVALFDWDTGVKIAETALIGAKWEETGVYDSYFVDVVATPLTPGKRYMLATEVAANDFVYGSNIMNFSSSVQWIEGRASSVGNAAMPATANSNHFSIVRSNEAGGSYFGPNLKFSLAKESKPAILVSQIGNTASNYSTGWKFSTNKEIIVTHLGQFDINGNGISAGESQVALYDARSKAQIVSATVSASATAEANGAINAYYAPIAATTLPPGEYIVAANGINEPFSFDASVSFAAGISWMEGLASNLGQTLPSSSDGFTIRRDVSFAYLSGTFKFQSTGDSSSVGVSSPTSRSILQRDSSNQGVIPIAGSYSGSPERIEARAVVMDGDGNSGVSTNWQVVATLPTNGVFSGNLIEVQAGGWYQLEVRAVTGDTAGPATIVTKVGIGDIYVTCGQSNSANYGQGGYIAQDDRVCARNSVSGNQWVLAADPMPIAGGSGGSVWPRLGDMLAAKENVPIGFISVGVGSTQVSEWLPNGSHYSNLLRPSIRSFPASGFRAVLWHQGESDAIASTSAATYAQRLHSIIAQSRIDAGWSIPWYVAEASYHPFTNLSQEEPVVAGQRLVVHDDPLVFLGPSTDSFHIERANGGKLIDSVHFNNAGLIDHAGQWRDVLLGTSALSPRNGDFEENRSVLITGLGPLADGDVHLVTTNNLESPSILGWRILRAAGDAVADGSNGFFNPSIGTYRNAVDSNNEGVLLNMRGKHVAQLQDGSPGNYFLHTTRVVAQALTKYTLQVALGVRDQSSSFGSARLEILANGTVVASANFDKQAVDELRGQDASGSFTDVSLSWTTGPAVSANQPIAIRVVKVTGEGTVIDFDNIRLIASRANLYESWIRNPDFGLSESELGFDADPDRDHLPNGVEALFGTNPATANSGLTFVSRDGTNVTLHHPNPLGAIEDIAVVYEWSRDLWQWYRADGIQGPPDGANVLAQPHVEGNQAVVTATSSVQEPRLFLRLKVILQPSQDAP